MTQPQHPLSPSFDGREEHPLETSMSERLKMTAARLHALQQIAEGQVTNEKHGYGAWRIHGAIPSVVGLLVARGLALWTPMNGSGHQDCQITPAGRAALAVSVPADPPLNTEQGER